MLTIICPKCSEAYDCPSGWCLGTHATMRCHCGNDMDINVVKRRLLRFIPYGSTTKVIQRNV